MAARTGCGSRLRSGVLSLALARLSLSYVARSFLTASSDISSVIAMFACLTAWLFILLALLLVTVGDPVVCIIKAIFLRLLPVDAPPLFSLKPMIYVVDASETTIAW